MRAPLTVSHPRPLPLSSTLLTEKWSRPSSNLAHHSRKAPHNTWCFMGTSFPQGVKTVIRHKNSRNFEIQAHTGPMNSLDIPDSTTISDIFNVSELRHGFFLADLDPATAKLAISFTGPFLSAFSFLFILRIVMSWYPKLPVGKFPYILAFAPTEPILIPTRKVIPPLGGVDVTPVVWFGLLSFLNEILVGPQGLLVLISQQR